VPARGRIRLTGRGCVLLLFAVFLVGSLLGQQLGSGWLGGASYLVGSLLAVNYARRRALLLVATTPPLIFLIALTCTELITATGSTLLATAEGTLLALATAAPWLFGGTAALLAFAMLRGLPQSIRDLGDDLSGRPGPAGTGSVASRQPDGPAIS
jgi:hypothetical protein